MVTDPTRQEGVSGAQPATDEPSDTELVSLIPDIQWFAADGMRDMEVYDFARLCVKATRQAPPPPSQPAYTQAQVDQAYATVAEAFSTDPAPSPARPDDLDPLPVPGWGADAKGHVHRMPSAQPEGVSGARAQVASLRRPPKINILRKPGEERGWVQIHADGVLEGWNGAVDEVLRILATTPSARVAEPPRFPDSVTVAENHARAIDAALSTPPAQE